MKFKHWEDKLAWAESLRRGLTEGAEKSREQCLESALSAMLTQFGMDEDEWNKATFNQVREALNMKGGA